MIQKQLSGVSNILAVSSGKGGVGKSVIATTMALLLSEKGKKVGLLDLDFYGPSCLRVLGADIVFPEEERGILPPLIRGVKVMSIEYFTRENPLPVRGEEISNAITELLAITIWGELDYLVIDLPPGMGDELLELVKLIQRTKHIIVTTPSILSINVVKRLVKLLKGADEEVIGGILNMVKGEVDVDIGVKILGKIRFDDKLDSALGKPEELLKTDFANDLSKIIGEIERQIG